MNQVSYSNLRQFAQANQSYNCGSYGQGDYDANDNCRTVTSVGGPNLADTGMSVALGIVGGVLLVVAAIVLLVVTRRKKVKKN
jgi:LPXTG-motif cell wall-anchored protein